MKLPTTILDNMPDCCDEWIHTDCWCQIAVVRTGWLSEWSVTDLCTNCMMMMPDSVPQSCSERAAKVTGKGNPDRSGCEESNMSDCTDEHLSWYRQWCRPVWPVWPPTIWQIQPEHMHLYPWSRDSSAATMWPKAKYTPSRQRTQSRKYCPHLMMVSRCYQFPPQYA